MRAAGQEGQRVVVAGQGDDEIGAGVAFGGQAMGAGFGFDDVECCWTRRRRSSRG